jgi:hypothetical protein
LTPLSGETKRLSFDMPGVTVMALTLAIFASLLQMHGVDATITSDNKYVEDLRTDIRAQLRQQADPDAARIIQIKSTIVPRPPDAGSKLKAELKPTESVAPPGDRSTIKALPKSHGSRR